MKKLKYIILLLITLSFCFNLGNINVYANENVSVSSYSAYLLDYNSNTVIFAKNENDRKPIASMTKIMLLLLAYENIESGNLSLEESVTVSKNASKMGGSQVFLEENGVYTVDVLLKSITVASANDASVAISERMYGSEKECVNQMNKKAKDLNLENTLFANCTGLPAPMQYSSAKDIAIIFSNLIKYDNYFKYSNVWMDTVNHSKNSTEISNTNKLIKRYEGCDGGKTGFTSEAGYCLTATAKRGNMRLIASVINAATSNDRFESVTNMFDYGFSNYVNKCVVDNDIPLEDKLSVSYSQHKILTLYLTTIYTFFQSVMKMK
ncbi:MAG: D-alanyl-D-alanine carboxypeptidase [Clostridia bacterium]|nr:D-alanyl-D-alanine carboxypeptidase [Clostridia bacterium]